MRRGRLAASCAAALLSLLAACAPRPPAPPLPDRLTLAPVDFAALPGWDADRVAAAVPAFLGSCDRIDRLAPATPMGPDGVAGQAADWRAPCDAARALPQGTPGADQAARRFFETWFRPFRAGNNGRDEGLFTGYYEPELDGARRRRGPYATPLLRRPSDLVTVDLGEFRPAWRGERTAGRVVDGRLVPYPDRAAIEGGALDPGRLALYWVADPVSAFFLEIQGSGRIRLPDGKLVQLGYDGQNGRPYVSIGRLLVERGALTKDEVSLPAIRAWIAAHPVEGRALMLENPSYVFFRELKGDGPLGAGGVALTPGRSLAIDRAFLPLGAPMWLDAAQTGLPEGDLVLRRLVVAQDTGGAIRGPVRGDLFWGAGSAAEARAGTMKARGAYYLLLPASVAAGRIASVPAGRDLVTAADARRN